MWKSVCAAGGVGLAALLCCLAKKKDVKPTSLPGGWASHQSIPPQSVTRRDVDVFHTKYHPYSEIVARLEATVVAHPSVAKLRFTGPLAILTLCPAGSVGSDLPQAWIEGGIHPCERIGPAVIMRLVDELLQAPQLLAMAEWHLVPVVEAEGYKITWEKDRWHKGCATGVNPNANFPAHWGELSAIQKVLMRLFPEILNIGKEPASEACVKAVIAELRQKKRLKLFLDFHSFGGRWLYPWAYTLDASKDREVHEATSQAAVDAANSVARDWEYKAIPAATMEAPFGGCASDFAYGEGCVHSYTVELPPNLPASIPNALLRSLWAGDLKLWWKEGMGLADECVVKVGDEMTLAVKAVAELALKS